MSVLGFAQVLGQSGCCYIPVHSTRIWDRTLLQQLISPHPYSADMQIGLLGKANVGKSTFFAAATAADVPTGNFPFTTIDPNVGVAHVRTPCACQAMKTTHDVPYCRGGVRLIPVKLIDVAGLVPGAHEGRGLGNKFLDAARQADVLLHIVDIAGATDIEGQPVKPGEHDPAEDVAFVVDEFDRWFGDILDREWQRIAKETEQKKSTLAEGIARRFSGLGIREHQVAHVLQSLGLLAVKPGQWTADHIAGFSRKLRETTKPMLVVANKADLIDVVPETVGGLRLVPCCAEAGLLLERAAAKGVIEYESGDSGFEMSDGATPQQRAALETIAGVLKKIKTTGIQAALNEAVFGILGMITVYPVEDESKLCNKDGVVLPKALLLAAGSTALDVARGVHADLADGFLHAIDCKTKQRIGADSKVSDGDVIKIVSARARGG